MKKIYLTIKYFVNSFDYLYNERNLTLGQVIKSTYGRARREVTGNEFKEFLADSFFNNDKEPVIMHSQQIMRMQDTAYFNANKNVWEKKRYHYYKITTPKNDKGYYIVPEVAEIPYKMWGSQCVNEEIEWYD